jgi:glycosyltransferase involved in cell wall biosynthesis
MSPQKNPLMALEALAGLRQYQWHFHMVGSGPLIDEIQHYVDNHNLKEFVSIHGWVESDKVRELMSQADVMLMPSSAEGLPVAAIEALREGVAIIGAGIPGLKDVLENDVTGLTVDRNAESIRVAVEYLIQHRSHLRRLQFSAWEHSKRFDLNRVVELYEQELLTRPGL